MSKETSKEIKSGECAICGTGAKREWLTVREAAAYLGVSYDSFVRLVKEGHYPVVNLPGYREQRRISRTRLDRMLREMSDVAELNRRTAAAGKEIFKGDAD